MWCCEAGYNLFHLTKLWLPNASECMVKNLVKKIQSVCYISLYSDVTWWHLKSTVTQLFVQELFQANNKRTHQSSLILAICENPLVSNAFPSQRTSNVANISILWHDHADGIYCTSVLLLAICEGNPSVTSGLSSQRASNVQNVSLLWYYYAGGICCTMVLLALCEGNPQVTCGFPSQRTSNIYIVKSSYRWDILCTAVLVSMYIVSMYICASQPADFPLVLLPGI